MADFELLACLGYIGDTAFAVGGVIAAKRQNLSFSVQFWSGIAVAAFGGFFIREWLLLGQTVPSILNSPREIELIIATAFIAITTLNSNRAANTNAAVTRFCKTALCVLDSIGISGFAAFGYGRGIQAGGSWWICLAASFATACCGGIIAAIIRSVALGGFRHFIETLADNKFYYVFGAAGAIAYGLLYKDGGYSDITLLAVTAIAIGTGSLVERLKIITKRSDSK